MYEKQADSKWKPLRCNKMYERERERNVGPSIHHRIPVQDEVSSPCCEGELLSNINPIKQFLSSAGRIFRREGMGFSISSEEIRGIYSFLGAIRVEILIKADEKPRMKENRKKVYCEFLLKKLALGSFCVKMVGTERNKT